MTQLKLLPLLVAMLVIPSACSGQVATQPVRPEPLSRPVSQPPSRTAEGGCPTNSTAEGGCPTNSTAEGGSATAATATQGARAAATRPGEGSEQTQGLAVTHHEIRLGDKILHYTATAGLLQVPGAEGNPDAEIFFIAYTLDGVEAGKRPLTFAFNGGPGASSMYLHMGAMGPKRAELGQAGLTLPKTLTLIDNDDCWLDATDMVFVDPVGTGYSRPANASKAKDFFGLHADTQSLGEFIRLYVTRWERWLSPKYLAGESYGATRAASLSGYLQRRFGMYLDGLVLVSSPLNFQLIQFAPGNDLPFALYLPTYTAAAHYHHKLPADLQADLAKALDESQRYALNEYLRALASGDKLDETQRKQVIARLARLTGLTEEVIAADELRVSNSDFAHELLKKDNKTLGLYDDRVAGPNTDTNSVLDDPSLSLVIGPYSATIQEYIRQELGYRTNAPYVFLSGEISRMWNWDSGQSGSLNVSPTLQQAMVVNPNLRVLMAAGRYDLVTGYFMQQYTAEHLGLPKTFRAHLTVRLYDAGHQIYTDPPARKQLHEDAREFFEKR